MVKAFDFVFFCFLFFFQANGMLYVIVKLHTRSSWIKIQRGETLWDTHVATTLKNGMTPKHDQLYQIRPRWEPFWLYYTNQPNSWVVKNSFVDEFPLIKSRCHGHKTSHLSTIHLECFGGMDIDSKSQQQRKKVTFACCCYVHTCLASNKNSNLESKWFVDLVLHHEHKPSQTNLLSIESTNVIILNT